MVTPSNVWSKSSAAWESHDFSYDENGQKKTSTDPLARVTTYTYDNRNRLYQTIEPKRADQSANPTTTMLYDFAGNKTKVTFPDAKTQQWLDYDAFGQPGRFIDERNNTTNLSYAWGPMKKLSLVKTHRDRDAGGIEDQPTTFQYNWLGKPTSTIFPDGTSEDTTYYCKDGDPSHFCDQPHSSTTRNGKLKTIAYDARGRHQADTFWTNTTQSVIDSTPGVNRVWDDAGRLSQIFNLYSTIRYTYDDAAQVSTEIDTIAGASVTKQMTYYRFPSGEPAHVIYPNGWRSRRDYTARGQLAATGYGNHRPGGWRHLPRGGRLHFVCGRQSSPPRISSEPPPNALPGPSESGPPGSADVSAASQVTIETVKYLPEAVELKKAERWCGSITT